MVVHQADEFRCRACGLDSRKWSQDKCRARGFRPFPELAPPKHLPRACWQAPYGQKLCGYCRDPRNAAISEPPTPDEKKLGFQAAKLVERSKQLSDEKQKRKAAEANLEALTTIRAHEPETPDKFTEFCREKKVRLKFPGACVPHTGDDSVRRYRRPSCASSRKSANGAVCKRGSPSARRGSSWTSWSLYSIDSSKAGSTPGKSCTSTSARSSRTWAARACSMRVGARPCPLPPSPPMLPCVRERARVNEWSCGWGQARTS